MEGSEGDQRSSNGCVDVSEETLWDFVDQGLGLERGEEVTRHVAVCSPCRQRLDDLRRLRSGLESIRTTSVRLPESIGPYRILRIIGEGGMGVVYEAEQQNPLRRVALKVIRPSVTTEQRIRAFRREIHALGRLSHPSIATIHDAGRTDDGCLYLVMERVEGKALDRFCEQRNLSLRERTALVRRIAEAVHYAHQRGVIHRDLKPANVLVDDGGTPHVLDFGLARFLSPQDDVTFSLTRVASPAGTAAYMSPEQLGEDGNDLDVRGDVYALGVILYQLLTGRLPYEFHGGMREALHAFSERVPAHPTAVARNVPRELGDVVMKAIATAREERYPSAASLTEDLQRFLTGRAVSARPPSVRYHLEVFARRHKLGVTAALALLCVPIAYVARDRAAKAAQVRLARAAVERAQVMLERYHALRVRHGEHEGELRDLREQMEHRFLRREKTARLESLEREVSRYRTEREGLFREIQSLTRRAAQEPVLDDVSRRVDSDLYVEKALGLRSLLWQGGAYWRRWYELRQDLDRFTELAKLSDPANPRLQELEVAIRVEIKTKPGGAAVHLFRYENLAELYEDGEPRLVPVPYRAAVAELPVRPGTWALSVVEARSPLARGDLVTELAGQPIRGTVFVAGQRDRAERGLRLVSIAGHAVESKQDAERLERRAGPKAFRFSHDGREFERFAGCLADLDLELATPAQVAQSGDVAALVLRDGVLRHLQLPAGAVFRITAAPLIVCPASFAGETRIAAAGETDAIGKTAGRPVSSITAEEQYGVLDLRGLEHRPYLVLVRREGCEQLRYFTDRPAAWGVRMVIELEADNLAPDGFAALALPDPEGPDRTKHCMEWMQVHEVTCGHYLEFLNDPETLERIEDARPEPILFPRFPANAREGGIWDRGPDGRYRLPAGTEPDHPVMGVSWYDAKAYAAWRTARAREAGSPLVFDLPRKKEWSYAAMSPGFFVWGNVFRPHWVKSCFAREQPCIEPVLSYPIDESPAGIHDLSGSAAEWLDHWLSEDQNQRWIVWGSWAQASSQWFRPLEPKGREPQEADDTFGFRLVARRPR